MARHQSIIAVLAATMTLTTAHAAQIMVTDDASIQAAIDASTPGDTVLVLPGTYREPIDFLGKAITVRGLEGAAATTIDVSGFGTSAVTFENGEFLDSILEGFTIKGGVGRSLAGISYGGGVYARYASPTIRHCVLTENIAGGGGGMYLRSSVGAVSDCTFIGNTATQSGLSGGAGLFISAGRPVIRDCKFFDNEAEFAATGGGISVVLSTNAKIINCLFARNAGGLGGGAACQRCVVTFTNCTFVENTATFSGGGVVAIDVSDLQIANSIVWGNEAGSEAQISIQGNSPSAVTYSSIQGGYPGVENRESDPRFVASDDGNYRLQPSSPCIDASSNGLLPEDVTVDLDGNERVINGTVDTGAFEVQAIEACPADTDGDHDVDFDDLLTVISGWGLCEACAADVTDDGFVGFDDLLLVISGWGDCL